MSTELLLLVAVTIWGINFTVIKLALRELSPLAFNALRFTLATALMLGALRLRHESLALAGRDVVRVIFLGLMGHTVYQLLFINGLARSSPANVSLLMATAPVFAAIYGHTLKVERNNRVVWAGILLSFSGSVLLILGGGGEIGLGGGKIVGDLLILFAAMVWAAYTVGSQSLLTRYSPLKLTALGMLAGVIPMDLISIPALLRQDWGAVSAGAWGGILFSSVFAVAIGYVLWYTSVQRVGNARTAVFSNLTPVVAVIVAWLVLGDRLAPLQAVSALVVLAGIMLTRRGRRKQA